MKIIGLTGGIASGKSTVARFLAELGAAVLDADKIGHEVLGTSSPAREQVISEFGQDILTDGGGIDRARLGRLVFGNPEALERLQRITHPAIDGIIAVRLDEYRRRGVKTVVLEAAALLESGKAEQADEIWVTTAPEAVVLQRIRERGGLSETEARQRIKAQLTGAVRIKHADVVIYTDCSLEELKEKVKELWKERGGKGGAN